MNRKGDVMTKSLVFIHGMFGASWHWDNFRSFFEERGFQCHTPVLRHHDIDPKDTPDPSLGTTSLLDYAQDLEAYIRKMDEKPLLIGHSMGGLLSQMLGARGIVSGVVLLTPASPSGINALTYSVIRSFWRILTKWGFWRKSHRPSFKSAVYSTLHLLPEMDQKSTFEKIVYESGRAIFEIGFWYLDPKGVAKVDETKVDCPVLVVSGALDRLTPASVVRKVAKKYKSVSIYKEFQNHSHWLIGEPGWEDIAEYVLDWIYQAKLQR
jgi:pimeloyl-ACP methyl ester carboxylesterase